MGSTFEDGKLGKFIEGPVHDGHCLVLVQNVPAEGPHSYSDRLIVISVVDRFEKGMEAGIAVAGGTSIINGAEGFNGSSLSWISLAWQPGCTAVAVLAAEENLFLRHAVEKQAVVPDE